MIYILSKVNSWAVPSYHVAHVMLHVINTPMCCMWFAQDLCHGHLNIPVGDSPRRIEEIAIISNCAFECDQGPEKLVGSVWAHCPQRRGFDPPLGKFSGREDFFPWSSHGFKLHSPQNSFRWEYKPRSSLCTHAFHRTDSKDPDVHVLGRVNAGNKNTPSMHHPRRQNVTTLIVGLKKTVRYAKISPKKWWTPEI